MRKLTDVFGKSRPSLNTWIFIPSLRLFSCGNCWSYSVHFHPKPHSLLSKCLFVCCKIDYTAVPCHDDSVVLRSLSPYEAICTVSEHASCTCCWCCLFVVFRI